MSSILVLLVISGHIISGGYTESDESACHLEVIIPRYAYKISQKQFETNRYMNHP